MQRRGPLSREGLVLLIDLLMSPSPAGHVGIVLREYRKRGWEFEQAWAQALRTLPRSAPEMDEWRDTLHQSKESWRAGYERTGAPLADPVALV